MNIARSVMTLLLVSLAPAANAQPQVADQVRLRPQWQALDANKDGKVTLAEVPPMLAASLQKSDADKDGVITLDEYVAFDLDPVGAGRVPLGTNVRLIEDIAYAGTGDPRQRVDIYLPKKATVRGPLPVIAYIHGGGWAVGSKIMARPSVMDLVNSGRYAAVSIGYRLSWQDKWPAQIYDVKAATRWIRANAKQYGFDPKRICAMGDSAGGHLAAQLGVTSGEASAEGSIGDNLGRSSKVQCVVDMFGPSDLTHFGLPGILTTLLGGTVAEKGDVARDASPISHVDASDPPFLIIQGTKDPLVNYQQSVSLDAALRKAGVPVFFQTVEGGGHGDFGSASPEIAKRIRAFLEHNFYDPAVPVPTDVLHK